MLLRMAENASPKRELTLMDCLGIGVNGIIGSGIFVLTAQVARQGGGKAPFAWLLTGGVCILVALCFAEASARTEKSGGPYRYAHDVFGEFFGFVVGWITLMSVVLGYAAVAYFFGERMSAAVFHSANPLYKKLFAVGLVWLLAFLNLFGVHVGSRTSLFISIVKIAALLAFVGVGLWFVDWHRFSALPTPNAGEKAGFFAASFTVLFALTGVEYVSVPAGEVRKPKRTVPLALVLSVLAVMILYFGIQVVVGGTLPNVQTSENALVDAAGSFGGAWGAKLMEVVYVISTLGFCAGSALVGPRYLEVIAQDRFLPSFLKQRTSKRNIPMASILTLAALVSLCILFFGNLVDMSNVAVICQYIATCVAVLIARYTAPAAKGTFVLPFGPAIPIVTILACGTMLFKVEKTEWVTSGVALGLGLAIGLLWRYVVSRNKKEPLIS